VRRLRGRMPGGVTLWSAWDPAGRAAGLTVSSTLVVDGDPGRVLGVVDDESALWEALRPGGRFAVAPLRESDARLADVFAGLMPSPGGPFVAGDWRDTAWGPVLHGLTAWAGCRLDEARQVGWSLLVEATIEQVEIATDAQPPLIHYRGRYLAGTPRLGS